MRTKTLSLTLTLSATMITLQALGQAGSTGGGATGGGAAPATGAGPANQGRSQTTQPRTITPGQRIPPNQPGFGAVTNPVIREGRVGVNTNQFLPRTNQFLTGATNQLRIQTNTIANPNTILPGVGQPTNRVPIVAGNSSNLPPGLFQNRALNGNDRTMLVQIQRNLRGIFPSPTTLAGVRFQVQQGVVTVVGAVQTPAQRQQILESISATPNVTQVVDQLRVNSPGLPATSSAVRTNPAGVQIPSPTGVPNQFGINPNAVPRNVPQGPTNIIPPANNP